jgi:amino acid adenylation domain-containing protein
VRQLLAGGDVLSGNHVQRVRNAVSECQLINGYGPTENTTFTACYPVPAEADVSEGVAIGSPINHTRAYVLDEDLELVPVGVTGELFAAGSGLARGYINQPALTAERFVPDPFGAPGSRMYRTGDRVRWRADGALEFVGRADRQVKIRGQRIELGEIESVLARHAGVAQAVVIAREDQPHEKRLVGYVVAVPGQGANPAGLTEYLSQTLPDYMVPSALVMLEALPLTVNGKIDRKALPPPDFKGSVADRKPRTPLEEMLCGLFADVLSAESVGIDDNFFALGGHSLLATRLVSRARVALGVELPIQSVFEWPTVAELSQHLGGAKARAPLCRQARPERVPLSFAQQRLWFLYRMEGPSPTYNIPFALRLHGAMDADALGLALADVVARHETLRTVFPEHDGVPIQHILPVEEARPALTIEEISESELHDRLESAAGTCIHLDQEMPLRVRLFRLERDCHVLFFLLHHIASDGWSLMPLARDVQQAYLARTRGHAPVFSELPVQYADYALWQRNLLGDENDDQSVAAQQLEFWRNALMGAPEELNLPVDRPRPAAASYRGEMLPLRIEAELHCALLQLAREHGASLFMVLQAALAALLSRLGAGEDIPIGTVIAGRGEESLAELVGFFVNTLVMRTDVSGNPSFVQLLQRVRSFALKAYAHQDLPFERLVELLQPLRSLARHPLFQVMLVLQNAPLANLELPGLTPHHEPLTYTIAKFDLTLRLDEHFNADGESLGMEGDLEFSSDLFNRSSAEMTATRFLRLLKAAVASPHAPLHCLEILTAEERRALLEEFNATMPSQAAPGTLTELFQAQAAVTPNAIAVTFGAQSLTYTQLNESANRLAHYLMQQGAGPEKLVGIALEPSPELIVAVVATLKAGAAYLPLDPDYPETRLAHMLADAAHAVVLSVDALRSRLPQGVNFLRQDAAEIQRLLDQMPADNPKSTLLPHHPAYVIYTSGSSGVPKGVVVTHHNVVRLFDATRHWFSFNANDVWTLFHSYAFDFSVWEIWGALLHGGRLVIAPKAVTRSPLEFLKLLVEEQVTVLNQTPSAFYQLIEADAENAAIGDQLSMRLIVFGGEALDFARLRPWYERHPDTASRLVNMYGITETTVHVSYQELDEQKTRASGGSLIGGNIPDLLIYLLDSYLEPVPVGVVGELYVGGGGLARGYWGRAPLTAERFVTDPYRKGRRMYRTGDLARRLSDGTLEYLGRSDQQVKIRGFRIELGEIEAALGSLPDVSQAAVIARDDHSGDKQLVAYLVAASGSIPDATVLRRNLSERLPEYMLPAAFVTLDALPRTANGKLDRQALPKPGMLSRHYRAPRTPEEEILCGIFAEALALERVGIDDNFFDLGGHSLIAVRLASQARSALGVELTIRTLFESPTVSELAERLSEAKRARKPLAKRVRPERLPLSYAQQRLWFLWRMEGPSATYNMPMALRMEGDLNEQALQQALWDVVARHEILRTIFPDEAGVPFQQILDPDQARPVLVKQEVDESALGQQLAEAVATAIDLSQELPLRGWLFAIGAKSHVLLLLLHHIAADGWSLAPLAREIEEAYVAWQAEQPPNWSSLNVQYADYTLWQRELLGDENQADSLLSQQMEFWRKELEGMPEELNLEVARARPLVASHRGTVVPIQLDVETHRGLLRLARRCRASLFMVLLAALAALLRKLGAGDDIPIGTVFAGRDEASLEGLAGFFVKTLVMRTRI